MNSVRLIAMIACLTSATISELKAKDDDTDFFRTKIEPILQAHCLSCHSHESGTMENGLTLDSRSGWSAGGDSGPVIVAGEPEQSLLIRAVRRTDSDLVMPPEESLTDAEVALLVEWVRRGATDPRTHEPHESITEDWWSLNPLTRPDVPGETDSEDSNHPIDAFVQAKLAEQSIAPAPQADRRTLIRRLYVDLHGMLPTPEAVKAFASDPDPLAFEKLVDRLLDSPRYGERWARHWLDVIHFADSHGCEHDVKRPNAWHYRDYVINSLNRDVSWARFIREQLATDVFYPEESQLTPALGFIAAGPLEVSRAVTAPVTFDYLDRDDMVTQTMAAFASTTANCARCHAHKFDPISQEDYYSLQAVFAGVGKGDVEFDRSPGVAQQRTELKALLAAAHSGDPETLLAKKMEPIVDEWERRVAAHQAHWKPLEPDVYLSIEDGTLVRQDDGSFLATGNRPDTGTYTITAPVRGERLTAIRLEVLSDPRLPASGPGRYDNGNFHLSEFGAQVFEPGRAEPIVVQFHSATADWNQQDWPIDDALDGNSETAWGIFPRVGESHAAVFELKHAIELKPGGRLAVSLRQLHGTGHLIGRFRLLVSAASREATRIYSPNLLEALQISDEARSQKQRLEIAAHATARHAEQSLAALPAQDAVYAVSPFWTRSYRQKTAQPPRVVQLLRRGEIDQPVREVLPGALSAIHTLSSRFQLGEAHHESERRAALANWLASPDNPLTWRSVVNRVWHYHFGRGICDTPNDFGRMGSIPSHPELLDWLAIWFRDDANGSLKDLHRLILTSRTWKQTCEIPSDQSEKVSNANKFDTDNRLLWRMNRRRLDAGTFRDSVLLISGRLDLTMGGPGIEQFSKSPGLQQTPKLDYLDFDWNSDAARRRSIYRVVWRAIADPFMESMDFPDLGILSPNRAFSVSALQSLTLFNNDFVLHGSEWFAARLEREHVSLDRQVRRAIELVWQREIMPEESHDYADFANTHGLAALCRVLLNSNEFLFVD